jgi:hypothetical protein
MKIKIFGCSFMAGTDLSSADLVWPSVIARDLGMQAENFARAGIGNLRIMESVLLHADPDSINIIGWTWIDRFDVLPSTTETWATLRPVLDHELAEHYFRYFHGQYRDMLTNLAYITAAIDHLERSNAPFLMTVMDNLLFESVRAEWHPPAAVHSMQSRVKPHVTYFDQKTFLQWARHNQFPISATLHPLESAHQAAADLIKKTDERFSVL